MGTNASWIKKKTFITMMLLPMMMMMMMMMIIIIIITITIIGINPLTNQNSIQEEINSRLKSGDVCYQSVQNCLSSNLLSKNIQIKIYRTTILPVVLYGCEIVRSH